MRYSRLTKWLEAEKLSARFLVAARRQAEVYFADADRVCSSGLKSEKAKFYANEFATRAEAYTRDHIDPLQLVLGIAGEGQRFRTDTSWFARFEAIRWSCNVEEDEAVKGDFKSRVDETLRRAQTETNEQVKSWYVELCLKLLLGRKQYMACEELVSRFLSTFQPQTLHGKAYADKLKEIQIKQINEKVAREVLAAVTMDLNGPGWNGNGHRMMCPNGHIYIIGNCGGAVVESRCVECGATIGGHNHRLAEGNLPVLHQDG